MNGGTLIQWLALALCIVVAAVRLPDAVRGRGRAMFIVLILLALAVALSLSPIYLLVDAMLGGVNVANLIIRFSLYAIVLLFGVRSAVAFGSRRAHRFIAGPFGLAAAGFAALATIVLFLLSDLPVSSTGLYAYADQPSVQWYADVGRIYPAYVAACLIGPAFAKAANRSARVLHRIAATFLGTGCVMIVAVATLKLFPINTGAGDVLLPFGAVVLVTLGLTLIRTSRRRAAGDSSRNLLADEHGTD